ncbi:hypothetical protein GCM10027292_01460 [Hydrogenophaga aquatica]
MAEPNAMVLANQALLSWSSARRKATAISQARRGLPRHGNADMKKYPESKDITSREG